MSNVSNKLLLNEDSNLIDCDNLDVDAPTDLIDSANNSPYNQDLNG